MNICFYTITAINPLIGGVERVTFNLQKYFEQNGFQVFFFHLRGKEDSHHFILPNPDCTTKEQIISFINDRIAQYDIDIIIDQYGNEFLSHKYISNHVKIIRCEHLNIMENKIISCLLGTFSFRELRKSIMNCLFLLNTPLRRFKQRYHYTFINKYIDQFIVLSDTYIPRLVNKGISRNKITAIPNSVNIIDNYEYQKDNLIIYCGRLVHNPKNILFLPKVWKHLSKLFPNWTMAIIGDGIDRGILEKKIKKYRLERIFITGYTNPDQYYARAKIILQPSFNEGFGMVLAEAMLRKCVPITFNATTAYSDIIQDNESGYIISKYNEAAFINKCVHLMSDEDERTRMSDIGYNHICAHFNMEHIGRKWIQLFNNITK